MKMFKFNLIFILPIFLFLTSCTSSKHQENIETDSISSKLLANSSSAFFSMPTPLETAILLKELGVRLQVNQLSSLKNVGSYTESSKIALNLGVYACDFCFTSVNDQSQLTLNYATVISDLIKQLGLSTNISKLQLDSLQINIANKAYVKSFISDHVLNNISELTEERKNLGIYTIMGGYVEGLYLLLSSSTFKNEVSNEISEAINGQKQVLNNIAALINQLDKNEVKGLISDISQLKKYLSTNSSDATTSIQTYDSAKKVTLIKLKVEENESKISIDEIKDLLNLVQKIRTSYIK